MRYWIGDTVEHKQTGERGRIREIRGFGSENERYVYYEDGQKIVAKGKDLVEKFL